MRFLMGILGVAGVIAALLAALFAAMAIFGLLAGPLFGIAHGVLAVANSTVNLADWYNQGAQIALTGNCLDMGDDALGNLFNNTCQIGEVQGIEFWNEAMSYRAARIVLPYALGALCTLVVGIATVRFTRGAPAL